MLERGALYSANGVPHRETYCFRIFYCKEALGIYQTYLLEKLVCVCLSFLVVTYLIRPLMG